VFRSIGILGTCTACAAANPAIASLLQSTRLVGRVAELGSLARIMRLSRTIQAIASTIALILAVYLCGYVAVRITHTKYWFDKSAEETGSYTFFDTWSESDTLLFRAFYPMLVADSLFFRRPFERDKW
jgi:hypothetical protein